MLIGLKLDIGFAHEEIYRRLYGSRDILPFLRELGFGAVETPVGPGTDLDRLREHIACCAGADLKVSLHPYSEATIFNVAYFSPEADNPCRQMHERFLAIAGEAARMQKCPTVVNLHGAAGGSDEAREQLLSRSIAFFTWAGRWCKDHAPEVVVTVELQMSPDPGEPRQRIGDTYAELLDVATQSGVGVCWDFGHAFWNTRRFGWPIKPPRALLKRIVHVHCHDASTEDHHPLVHGAVPWRDFIGLLLKQGFDGRVILEVPPDQFLRAGGVDSLIDSAKALNSVCPGR
ncbi:MAG: sugar phosphate isomerase/epimerase [Phycisphaerae bacterium]|nr:sugar phosphate isomerase/epimerase [Phycisphaerae bacterium]